MPEERRQGFSYDPATYQQGNSYHHVTHATDKQADDANLVMSYTLEPGVARRDLSAQEIKLMQAMGWETSSASQKKQLIVNR